MTTEAIESAMKDHYTFICATCPKLHALRSRGKSGCLGNIGGRSCSGPMAGGSYPEYSGPLAKDMTARCFLTGADSTGAVEMPDGKLIGVSELAISALGTYTKGGERPPFLTMKSLPVLG